MFFIVCLLGCHRIGKFQLCGACSVKCSCADNVLLRKKEKKRLYWNVFLSFSSQLCSLSGKSSIVNLLLNTIYVFVFKNHYRIQDGRIVCERLIMCERIIADSCCRVIKWHVRKWFDQRWVNRLWYSLNQADVIRAGESELGSRCHKIFDTFFVLKNSPKNL